MKKLCKIKHTCNGPNITLILLSYKLSYFLYNTLKKQKVICSFNINYLNFYENHFNISSYYQKHVSLMYST